MLDVVILEKNYEKFIQIFNQMEKYTKYKVQGVFKDETSLIKYLDTQRCDILILDIRDKRIDGINILEIIKEKRIMAKILLLCNDTDYVLKLINNNLHVDEIVLPPHDMDVFVEKLDIISRDLKRDDRVIVNRLEDILKKFDFSKSSSGYYYIIECLKYSVLEKYEYISSISELYGKIASLHRLKSPDRIEWNIAKSIDTMNSLTSKEVMFELFLYEEYPSPKVFLNEVLNVYNRKYNVNF